MAAVQDVLIYGGTSAAIASAIQAARSGLSVTLVFPDKHLGGIQVEGLGATDIDNQPSFRNSTCLGGLALEFHERISTVYGRLDRLREALRTGKKDPSLYSFESRVAEQVILDWLAEYPSIQRVHGRLESVQKQGQKVTSIRLAGSSKSLSAKVFLECTYEGDLLAAAGISTRIGREAISEYGESLAGVRDRTPYTQFPMHIDPYRQPGRPESGLLYGISDEGFGQPGSSDRHLAAYSFRLPLTDVESNKVAISKPRDYDPSMFELHRRYARAGGTFYLPRARIPGRKTDLIGSEAVLATDLLGMNDDWPEGSYETRQRILQQATTFTRGLMYFFTSDPCLPDAFRREWSRWGYCRDEFPDNDHFPRGLYIRDARRMVSDLVITQHTASLDSDEADAEDPIAVAYWPTDTHCARRVVRDGSVHNEGFIFKDGHRWKPFGISYRALVPKRSEVTNLLAPTCPSSSHVGYGELVKISKKLPAELADFLQHDDQGAVRLEHQFWAMGQACALAASISIRKSCAVQDVPYVNLKGLLLSEKMVIDASKVGLPDSYPDCEVDQKTKAPPPDTRAGMHEAPVTFRPCPVPISA